ncbi:EamA-like transporter [Gracilaria domingensis]|nr:EamA-like transporter [Gracilaria domingensis]
MGSVRFTMGKLFATALSIAGVAIISLQDESEARRSLAGDLISIGSSFVYALYTILLDRHTERATFSMSMMLGFLGLVTLTCFWPGLFLCSLLGWESFQFPKGKVLAMLLLNGLIGTVLSDFLWAKSVELAGPMIGTLSLSLAVPLSVIADYYLQQKKFALIYLLGILLVLMGFLLMNYEIARDRREEKGIVESAEVVSELETLS